MEQVRGLQAEEKGQGGGGRGGRMEAGAGSAG